MSEVDRRQFVKVGVLALGAGYAAAAGIPLFRYRELTKSDSGNVGGTRVVSLALPGAQDLPPLTALEFLFDQDKALLIRHADQSWSCFFSRCTHQGCTVAYEPENDRLLCPCHSGTFDPRTGQVLGGPPKEHLAILEIVEEDDRLVVRRPTPA